MTSLHSPLAFTRGPAMKNRFMLAPLTNLQSHPDGTLSDDEFRWLTMRAEGGFGLTMDHMVKQNAFYKGEAHADAIVQNQKIRTARYTEPAGASTGVPFRYLGLEGMTMEVEIIAME